MSWSGLIKCVLIPSVLLFTACNGADFKVVNLNGKDFVIPAKCESSIKYSGKTWGAEGIKIPIQLGTFTLPIEIGKLHTDYKQIQEASKIAEVLDQRRRENCQAFQVLAGLDETKRLDLLMEIRKDSERVQQLALLMTTSCDDCIKKWILSYRPIATALNTPDAKALGKLPSHVDVVVPFETLLGS
ncbi:MAG: hypothetical protein H8K04_15025 [Nitrospira sp.]